MFGDVYNNRSQSLPESPAGSEPSPLLTRLLIPAGEDSGDLGATRGMTNSDNDGEVSSSGRGVDIHLRGGGDQSTSPRHPLLGGGGGDSPRGVTHPFHRDAPLPSTSSADRIYAFDPWTKVPVILRARPHDHADDDATPWRKVFTRRLRWCWLLDDPSWWVAFCYLLGSLGFATGAFASCVARITSTPRMYLIYEVMPYVIGGSAFLAASVLLVFTSYHARYGEPGRADRKR